MSKILTLSALRMIVAAPFAFTLNLGITTIMHQWLLINEEISFLIALVTVTCTNFFLLRHFVYRASAGSIKKQFLGFISSTVGFRVGEYLAYLLLVMFFDIQYQLAITMVLLLSFILKYIFFGRYVFVEGPMP